MLQSDKLSIYRFNHPTPANLPLSVRSSGSYTIRNYSDTETPFQKWFSELFWCEYGSGEYTLNGKNFTIHAGDIFHLSPGDQHDLKPKTIPWRYHWFTLDHELAPQLLKAFGIKTHPLRAGDCPVSLFEKLQAQLEGGTIKGDREAAHWAHAILLAASEISPHQQTNSVTQFVDNCKQRIDTEYEDPQLDINEIANNLNIHRSTLFRSFKQLHQISPSRYLQNRRIERALKLLKETNLPIKEVASKVGILDPNYFARSIRHATGLSPRNFRFKYRTERSLVS